MAVHIRLTRVGATKRPAYRVIAIDSRRSRDGRALEILGYYDPLSNPVTVKLDDERIANWMARGARPSPAVQRLMKIAAEPPRPKKTAPAPAPAPSNAEKPRRVTRPKKQAEAPDESPIAAPVAAAEVAESVADAEPASAEGQRAEAPETEAITTESES